jgi:hypothetical protein
VAGATTALGNLRRALREFLDASGSDPSLKGAATAVRALDSSLGQASRGNQDGPTPGQRASGTDQRGPTDNQDSPGRRAAAASTPSGGPPGPPRNEARAQMGAPPNSAKGSGNSLPPFMQRQKAKSRATARKGP